MFIKITSPSNPLKTAVFLLPYQQGKKTFTPNTAKELLSMTNHPKNIKDMLNIIVSLPKEEQAQYKDVILATFDHREQPKEILAIGQQLAATHHFESELKTQIKNVYDSISSSYLSGSHKKVYTCEDDVRPNINKLPTDCPIYFSDKMVDLSELDLASFNHFIFSENATVDLVHCKNLPENLDVSKCSKVNFSHSDLAPVKNLTFKKGSTVILAYCNNIPQTLDLSMCDRINLSTGFGISLDLSFLKNFTFAKNSKVSLSNNKNLPEDLDVSMCSDVDISCTDLHHIKNLTFAENSVVDLHFCLNIPNNLDISRCKNVNLSFNTIPPHTNLTFAEGSRIDLSSSTVYTSNLDFSNCAYINLHGTDLHHVKHIKFKNKQQMEQSDIQQLPPNFLPQKITYKNPISNFLRHFRSNQR
ncbi:MAG: hypothetical protein NC218_11500 [Acetobacter sp.]|nr:hypothetical protein [Acetobacter sp.]